jgi:hypothetical protein
VNTVSIATVLNDHSKDIPINFGSILLLQVIIEIILILPAPFLSSISCVLYYGLIFYHLELQYGDIVLRQTLQEFLLCKKGH